MTRAIPEPFGPDIITFVTSEHFLNKPYISTAQRSVLKALYGLEMTREERLAFLEMSEGREPKAGGYQEAVIVSGVRAGKSDVIGGVVMTYECVRWGPVIGEMLTAGQVARGILIAENQKQAGEIRGYIEGNLQTLEDPKCGCGSHWPGGVLAKTQGQERAITGSAIKLSWPIEIVIYPANRVAVRGATGLCAVLDEIAYWQSGEGAYNQDVKTVRAVRSRFGTLAGIKPKRIMISSPDEEAGVLWEEYRRRDVSKALVLCCPTDVLNPSIDQEFLDAEQEKDPEQFLTDYQAQFRKAGGGNTFLPAESVDQCIARGVSEVLPRAGIEYAAWMDAAFKRDRFSFGIGHSERGPEMGMAKIDYLQHWTPSRKKGVKPLDDDEIVTSIVAVLRVYGISTIYGDQHCDVVLKNKFEKLGITFVLVAATTSEKFEAFKNLRAALKAKLVSLLDDEISIRDLKGLVRHETKDGYTVSAPKRKGSYDDAATVVSRLVMKLLPLNMSVDLSEINASAAPKRIPGVDWREPAAEGEFAGNLMEAVY